MATDAVTISNRALQKLGAARITSLSDNSRNARSCNACYDSIRKATLRNHPWNFAIKRAILAADSSAPVFGRARSFQQPADFLRILPPYPEDDINSLDWIIEGQQIYTDDVAPLNIRYIADITDPSLFDSLFSEALSSNMALEMCEELTQSNSKKADISREADRNIAEAKKVNALEKVVAMVPDDFYITVRN